MPIFDQNHAPKNHLQKLRREDLLLFSYFAFAGKNMKSQCRNHLFFRLNFFKP